MGNISLIRIRKIKDHLTMQAITFWQKKTLVIFFFAYLALSLIACSSGNTSPQTTSNVSTPTHPTPTSLPKGTLLYQTNWSHGIAGWHGTPGWKVSQGFLQSDLSNENFLTSQYMPAVPNYAIEVRFKIISVPKNGGSFVIMADKTTGKDGYTAGILNLLGPGSHSEFANPEVLVYLDPQESMDSSLVVSDYEPGSNWHTYRVEVNGPGVDFFIDGLKKSSANSSKTNFLSNGPIHLRAEQAIIRVQSVMMTSL